MTKRQILLIQFGIIVGLIFATAMLLMLNGANKATASVDYSAAAYQSTTTRPVSGTAINSPAILSLGYGVFGSVIITGTGTGTINFYDATSTAAGTLTATTTLASFPASTAVGTYVFDIQYTKGLVMEVIGSVATSTVTWKK